MKKLVLISGQQGAGKTTIAKRVTQELWSLGMKAARFKFADVLYQMHDSIREILRRNGVDDLKGIDGDLLQLLGTEWGRKTRGEDIWVRCLRASCTDYWALNPGGIIVIDDCRFENELRVFAGETSIAVTSVRLRAPRETRKLRAEKWRENESHPSEVALNDYPDEWFSIVADTSLESVGSVTGRIVSELTRQAPRTTVIA